MGRQSLTTIRSSPRVRTSEGFLARPQGHTLWYEVWGSTSGLPIVHFHGGPGGGTSTRDQRFFNKRKHRVLFFDQRGCGKSQPTGLLRANTTQALVADTFALMDHAQFKRAVFMGGSWGSFLALLCALEQPQRALGLLLRGIFLGTRSSIDFLFAGGSRAFHPEAWERFQAQVPIAARKKPLAHYFKKLSTGSARERRHFAYEFSRYEMSLLRLETDPNQLEAMRNEQSHHALAVLESLYMMKKCFVPENHILRHLKRIRHIPLRIVHGRYDCVCPPSDALALARAHGKNAQLHFVVAGHSSSEPVYEAAIMQELAALTRMLKN
jgi:proline iminopeptidase